VDNKESKKPEKQLKNIAVLSGIAIQMGVTIYLFVIFGKWLDAKFDPTSKLFLITMTLLGVGISLYAVIKQVNRIKY
jgi:F0F1-type ATP synthase assembly protein I